MVREIDIFKPSKEAKAITLKVDIDTARRFPIAPLITAKNKTTINLSTSLSKENITLNTFLLFIIKVILLLFEEYKSFYILHYF